jgi:hypothetical protein
MAENEPVPEADALDQGLPPLDADGELIDVDDDPEIGFEVSEADAVEQSRARAVPTAVSAKPMPPDAPEHDVLDQRLAAGEDDDEDDFR